MNFPFWPSPNYEMPCALVVLFDCTAEEIIYRVSLYYLVVISESSPTQWKIKEYSGEVNEINSLAHMFKIVTTKRTLFYVLQARVT